MRETKGIVEEHKQWNSIETQWSKQSVAASLISPQFPFNQITDSSYSSCSHLTCNLSLDSVF